MIPVKASHKISDMAPWSTEAKVIEVTKAILGFESSILLANHNFSHSKEKVV